MLFGFLTKRKIYRLRRKYDRVRERTDKMKPGTMRNAVLTTLDRIDPTIVILEEQDVNIIERGRMIKYVNSGIKNARDMMKHKVTPKITPPTQPVRRR